ncbi:MAG: autotransporter-associated beta strand repeat-containing protein, partial [Azovibrio sp.]
AVAACFRLPALVIGIALLPQGAALAANLDWIEPGTGDWAVGANWSLGSIPGSADDVSVSNGGTTVIDGGTRQANFIRIGKGAGQEGTVVVDGNAQVTVSSETNVGSSGKGTLILNSGTVASSWAMRIGESTGSEGRVVVNGGRITNATDNNFVVGRGGKGLLEVNNSGWVSSDWAFIGGEIWRASLVGQGTGTVVLNNTALFDNRAGIVFAAGAASKGSATLNDNSTMTTNNAMYLGYDGQADITVNGGLVNSNTHFYIGTNAGSSGELTVNQGGTVQAGGNFYAGYTGSGKVNVNGGVLQATAAVAIGFFAAGKGEVTVSQGGSFSTNSSLYVGNNGTGKLTLDDGLVHAGGAVWVGSGGSSQGTLILNGGVLETNQLSGNLGSSQVSFNGGTLRALADNPNFISSIGSPIQVGAGGMTVDTNGKAAGITSSLASARADATLIKTGAGSLVIAANNSSFSGNVLVQQGSLNLAYAQTFANAASVTLKQGSTLDTQGTQQTLRQLTGATGSSLLNSSLLQLYTLDATESTFSGIISGTGSLTKNGAGQLNLAGNGSTQGSVFVQQGTLNFVQDGAFTTTGDYRTGNGAVSYLGLN